MKRAITDGDPPDSSADLWPAWKVIQLLEERGVISADEARRREEQIYEAMWWRGLEPDDLIDPAERLSAMSVVRLLWWVRGSSSAKTSRIRPRRS